MDHDLLVQERRIAWPEEVDRIAVRDESVRHARDVRDRATGFEAEPQVRVEVEDATRRCRTNNMLRIHGHHPCELALDTQAPSDRPTRGDGDASRNSPQELGC